MENAIDQISAALANSISMNDVLRKQANEFLGTQCEPNPQFQLALLHIITHNGGKQATPEQKQLQYQAILCMKNSLTRILQTNKRRVFKSSSAVDLSDELKDQIKAQLLQIIQVPDQVVPDSNTFEQLVLVLCIFAQYDFPAKWQELNQYMLSTFDQLYANLMNLSANDIPIVNRFLGFYAQIMKVQNKKKLSTSKGQFNKVARDHLTSVFRVWTIFNERQTSMLIQDNQLNFSGFNQHLFDLTVKLDKCVYLVLACGFNLNELLNQPTQNNFIQVVGLLLEKLRRYIFIVQLMSETTKSEAEPIRELILDQIKNILRYLTDLQHQEALIIYEHLGIYIQTLAEILFQGRLFSSKINRWAIFALYRVLNTQAYNQGSEKPSHSDGIGILVSPSKFKNFEPQLTEAGEQYKQVLEAPDLDSQDPKAQQRQDGAKKLIDLLVKDYLPSSAFQLWQESPEQFIELEDENQFISEYDMDADCSMSLLSYQLLEKIISCFYQASFTHINWVLFKNYFGGKLVLKSEKEEDALFTLAGILGKIQRELKVPIDKRLDINYVLGYICNNKWSSKLFMRRFTHILRHWTRLLPKKDFIQYLNFLVTSLGELTDVVLIYEHCQCIHELLKEIDQTLKNMENNKNGGGKQHVLQKDLFSTSSSHSSEEEEATICAQIEAQINYAQLFQIVAKKTIPLVSSFKQPNIIWNMVNYLTFLLEKNCGSNNDMVECFKIINLQHMLQINSDLVDEALIDMLKHIFVFHESSDVILQMCKFLLNLKLGEKPLHIYVKFWLFITRAVDEKNPTIGSLHELLIKFFGYGELVGKKDYLLIDFLKVLQEYVLLGFFRSESDVQNLVQYVNRKFTQETQYELTWIQNQENANSNEDYSSLYEKKLNILQIAHILLFKEQKDQKTQEFILRASRPFVLTILEYLCQCKVCKSIPSSSLFFTGLLTYINRVIISKPDFFLHCLGELQQKNGLTIEKFVEEWILKMECLISQEARRINLVAIYSLIPYLSSGIIQKSFGELAKATLSQLDTYLYLKQTNNDSRFYSPAKLGANPVSLPQNPRVKINHVEKISSRLEALKKEDPILDLDIIDFFKVQMQKAMVNLQVASWEPFRECIQTEHWQNVFTNVVAGAGLA